MRACVGFVCVSGGVVLLGYTLRENPHCKKKNKDEKPMARPVLGPALASVPNTCTVFKNMDI